MRIFLFYIIVAVVGFTETSCCSRTSEPTLALKTGDIFSMVKKPSMGYNDYHIILGKYFLKSAQLLASCNCSAGDGTTCSEDLIEFCEYFLTVFCKPNGNTEDNSVSKANGCVNCGSLYILCPTTCNYCDQENNPGLA